MASKGYKIGLHKLLVLYVSLAVIFILVSTVFYSVAFPTPIDTPPTGPITIGLGPSPQATVSNTMVTINFPENTIDVDVTFIFNQTAKYFIYVTLPYTISETSANGVYNNTFYPLSIIQTFNSTNNSLQIGNFSSDRMNTERGSILNATVDLNPDFPFPFQYHADDNATLTLGVTIKVNQSMYAIENSFGEGKTAIFTFFGNIFAYDKSMAPFTEPNGQDVVFSNAPFKVFIILPSSYYLSSSQPAPIEYYVDRNFRNAMFSIDFSNGLYTQALSCNFENSSGQSNSQLYVFLLGVFVTLSITFGLEAFKEFLAFKNSPKNK